MATKLIYSRARPVRLAFLVEDNAHSDITLDGIFGRCFGVWGGRFSLVVPCENGRPKAAYNEWLEHYDPDVVYSYVRLSDAVVEELHEKIYPSFLVHHAVDGEIDAHALRPHLPTDPLKVTTLLPIAAGPAPFEAAQPTRVLDSLGRMGLDRFVQDSFGYWTNSIGTSFQGYLRQYAKVLFLVAENEAQPRERYVRPPDESIASTKALIDVLTTSRVTPMSRLSAMLAPRLEINNTRFGHEFNIVVGDTFADRLFYWNCRAHFPKWRDNAYVDLRIPESALADSAVVEALSQFLRNNNHMTHSGSGGTPLAAIRSCSVESDKLEAFAAELKKHHSWGAFRVDKIESAEVCIPPTNALKNSNFVISDSLIGRGSNVWSESSFQDNEIKITAPTPDHLRYSPTGLLNPFEGTWAVTVDAERGVDYSRYSNEHQHWRLPRRLRMASSFVRGYQIPSQYGQYMQARVERGGLLALYANSGSKFPTIREPNDFHAFQRSLMEGRDWYPFERGPVGRLNQLCRGFERSENGRYFWGVLQIFGDLNDATRILLSPFWQAQFELLGASSSLTESRRTVVEQTLRNRFRSGTINFRSEADLNRLANIVLNQAEQFRTFVPTLSWDALEAAYRASQKEDWTQNPPDPDMPENEKSEMHEAEIRSFIAQVKWLSRIGVLHQGYEHRCRKCLHRSWIGIDAVKKELTCEVCNTAESAPVSQPWRFRLNEFVREALRKHGILSIFWAIAQLRGFREESFFFEGPSDIWFEAAPWDSDGPETDLDLICVVDGKVHICEVKQSGRQLRKTADFSAVVRRLRPDVAVIAVMESSSARVESAFREFEEQLDGTNIEPKLLTYDKDQVNFLY